MTNAAAAAALIEALEIAAEAAQGGPTALVSATIEILAAGEGAPPQARVVRKTKTLVFAAAEIKSESGALLASATSVHKIVA
ncbi:MAG: hypothetical protein JNK94_07360 [Hyphomonadaceae bacterium]|mgnify:CR=1 FL=1|nr:hypothetical protein [Hyphomonadaceae bacterium]